MVLNKLAEPIVYTTWRNQTLSDQHSSRELVYLAYVGSGYIADALARCSSLQQESIERLVSDWHTLAYQRSMASDTAIQQPAGLIKPRWGQHLNYALAYLIEAARLDDLSLGEFAVDLATRHALLEAGLGHRSIQAYMQNLDVERDWLDSLLVADVGWGVADILVSSSAGNVESWSEEEKRRLSACAIPEAGIAAIAERLTSLPSANEQEVLQVIGMSFLAAPSWNEKAYQVVQALIHPASLEQIKRFPMAFGELIWRLIELLTTNQALLADLENQTREIAFGVPVGLDNTGDLIETQAAVLSRVAGFSQCMGEIQTWLRTLATDERIALPNVRRGVKPFVELCPSYPDDVQQAIAAVLIEMATDSRFSHLWELKRIRREFASGYQ
jgi:hypothetical protein